VCKHQNTKKIEFHQNLKLLVLQGFEPLEPLHLPLKFKIETTSQLEKAGAAAHAQKPGTGKIVNAAVEGKLHRRGGMTHFPCEL
jgi:hypothetical protein